MMHTAVFCCARLCGTGLRAALAAGGEKTGGDRDGDDPVFSYSTYPEME